MRLPARNLLIALCLVATLALPGCGGSNPLTGSRGSPSRAVEQVAPAAQPAEGFMAAPTEAAVAPEQDAAGNTSESPALQPEGDRMIIRTADVTGKVKDVQVAVAQVRGLAEAAGGYLVEQRVWTEGDELRAQIVIRVPAERFDGLLEQVTGVTTEVVSSSVYGQDVTEEYFDLDARLRALRATEEQLLLLLEDVRESMKQAEDILAVYRELQGIRSQIEQLQGRQQFLDRMVAMSTINLSLVPVEAELPVVVGGWRPLETARDALRSLSGAIQGLVNLGIWGLLFVVPILLVLVVPLAVVLIVIRAIARRRRSHLPAGGRVAPPSA